MVLLRTCGLLQGVVEAPRGTIEDMWFVTGGGGGSWGHAVCYRGWWRLVVLLRTCGLLQGVVEARGTIEDMWFVTGGGGGSWYY